jgi:methylmalonyl-CoA/ethylmalonyl-CoA epimerase
MPLSPIMDEMPVSDAAVAPDTSLELDHLGLIVPELEAGRLFLQALGVSRWTRVIEDPVLRVFVQFGSAPGGGLNYELVAPLGEDSPIINALRTGKHILNHLAYLTPDLHASGERLREAGCHPAGEAKPAVAYGGSLVQFWMSPLRFVIELIEKPGHHHVFQEKGE